MKSVLSDKEFKNRVKTISQKFKQSQIKAAIKANGEMSLFYFTLGKEIASNSFKAIYGSKFY